MRAIIILLFLLTGPAAAREPLSIVATLNVYGDVAQQIAGPDAAVHSILSNADQDPHLFEVSPSVARLLSSADVVVQNGLGYDAWMTKLLSAARSSHRAVIVVADLVHRRTGDNPHIWYDPFTMPAYAKAVATVLAERDPARSAVYDQRLRAFVAQMEPLSAKVVALRAKFDGNPVTATEPVFAYMAAAIGLRMRNERFQLAIMNETEPRISDVAAFENDLRQHAVRMLIYNSQATRPITQRLIAIARQMNIPVVGVTETKPNERSYQDWIMSELDQVEHALASPSP